MDTSKEYVGMCYKAKGIQEYWAPSDWDYMYALDFDTVDVITGTETDGGLYGFEVCHVVENKDGFVWLPRQDQLQAMLTPEEQMSIWQLISSIDSQMKEEGYEQISWEMIWLAYVMVILYGKEFYESEWVDV